MSNNKLYGYFRNGLFIKISSDKELLQEILMDDYYEEAYYQYNYLVSSAEYWLRGIDGISSPRDFWHHAKEENFNEINSRLSNRVIKDLEDYRVE